MSKEIISQELYKPAAESSETLEPIAEAQVSDTENQKKITEKSATAKDRLEDFLKQEKILENIDGYNIFDINKFFSQGFIVNKLQHQHLGKLDGKKVQGSYKLIFEQLGDMPVVSRDDFAAQKERGDTIKTKPLFNIPASLDEALDINKTRQAEYYLNYWDLKDPSRNLQINWQYKIRLKNEEEIGADELALFTKIFKDHQGKRDEAGNLLVYDGLKRDYVRLTTEWIKANIGGLGGSPNRHTDITASPHQFLLQQCQNLLDRNLIRFKDFNIKTNDKSGDLLRKEFDMSAKNKTDVMINGVKYYIGRDNFIYEGKPIPMENIKVVVLDNQTAGIVKIYKGRESLLFTFKLLDKEEKEKKRQEIKDRKGDDLPEKIITALSNVGGGEMKKRLSAWRPTNDNPKGGNENSEAYAERIRYIGDYENLKQISGDFSRECGIGIHNLSWRAQQWLCGAVYELGSDNYGRMLEFGKQYGLAGLKTFLSVEQSEEMGEKILALGEKLKDRQETADKIFSKYNEIVSLTEKSFEELKRMFKDEPDISPADRNLIIQNILSRGSALLINFSDKLKSKGEVSSDEVMRELSKYQADVILFVETFKTLNREGKHLELADFKNIGISARSGQEIPEGKKRNLPALPKKIGQNIILKTRLWQSLIIALRVRITGFTR